MKGRFSLHSLFAFVFCLFLCRSAVAQTGTVLGFGDNTSGQIGDKTTSAIRSLASPAFHISGIKSVACGYSHTLALDSNGNVWAWGGNTHGQLGVRDTASRTEPVLVMGGIRTIAAGDFHSMALDSTGRVWAWGYNLFNQLGTGDGTDRLAPTLMAGSFNSHIKAISAGGSHSLVLSDQNALYGCGSNLFGQLGLPDSNYHASLTFLLNRIVAMSAGGYHSLIQVADNSVWGSGLDTDGQLGDNAPGSDPGGLGKHHWVYAMAGVRLISAGVLHSLAVGQNGRAYSWGRNTYGQLGLGGTAQQSSPAAIPNLTNVKAVAAGYYHSLVLTAGGKVFAAGQNTSGQLGDGTTALRVSPVPVKNATFNNFTFR